MCDKCKKNYGIIEIKLIDRNGTKQFCPNCLAYECYNGLKEKLENTNQFSCDISGKIGAICFKSDNEEYILEKEIMMRLLRHSLKPDEFFVLAEKYDYNNYMLHDDFYDFETGEAIQPMD